MKEAAVAKTSIEPLQARKEFGGERYTLTKINYSEEDAKADEAYHKERGRKTKIVKNGIFWLLYTRIGQ